jgi:hypothetical protein
MTSEQRQEMIDRMTAQDIKIILGWVSENDYEFLVTVLQGEGFKPYNQLSDDQVKQEYDGREGLHDIDVESIYQKIKS